jgi:alpha-tubulin N-acetyltransferase 1
MGYASQKAQGLPAAITTAGKFFGAQQKLFLKVDCESSQVLGLLKVGEKKLFYRNEGGHIRELSPLCVLDFYVHESC